MIIKEAGKNGIFVGIVMVAVFYGMAGIVTADIEIRDFGIDMVEEGTGYIDFVNNIDDIFLEEDEEYNVTGILTVYDNGMLIHEENITLEVISFHGFAVNRPNMREFGIIMTEGTHELTACIESDGQIVETVYEYDVEAEEVEEEVEEDWLECP